MAYEATFSHNSDELGYSLMLRNNRKLITALVFIGFLALPGATLACDRSAATDALGSARAAFEGMENTVAATRADNAARDFLQCAGEANGDDYYTLLASAAGAYSLEGAAKMLLNDRAGAVGVLRVARSLFYKVSKEGNEQQRDDAAAKLARIERNVPEVAGAEVADAAPQPNTTTAQLVAHADSPPLAQAVTVRSATHTADFTVLKWWVTHYQSSNLALLHIRVNLQPTIDVVTQPSDFRIVLNSPDFGTETIYGRNGPAPSFYRVDYTTNPPTTRRVATISPVEDLGYDGRLQIHSGDALTKVVTFVVRADINLTDNDIAALEWRHRLQP
jgi:hypothetical protein